MDLFDQITGQIHNLLPYDGTVHYYGPVVARMQADTYLQYLLNNIAWKNDEAVIYGNRIVTKRKIAWYGNAPYAYTYSHTTKTARSWTPELLHLKNLVEDRTGEVFNSCLLNLYHNGEEGMSWHCDEERDLKKDGAIASFSFGAERKFSFKHKQSKETTSKHLEHGGLLVMKGTTQTHWLHCLPKAKCITTPRVNLTFRNIAQVEPI